MAIKISSFPDAAAPAGTDSFTGLQGGLNKNFSFNQAKFFAQGLKYTVLSTDYTVLPTDKGTIFLCSASITITLSIISSYPSDFWFGVKHYSASLPDTVTVTSPDQIEYLPGNLVLSKNQSVILFPNTFNWGILNCANDGGTFYNPIILGTDSVTLTAAHNRQLLYFPNDSTSKNLILPANTVEKIPLGCSALVYNSDAQALVAITSPGTIIGFPFILTNQMAMITKIGYGVPNTWLVQALAQNPASLYATGGQIDGVVIGANTPVQIQGYTPVNAQTGTAYTLVLADSGKLVTLNNASAIALTVPSNSNVAYPLNTEINLAQLNVGQATVTPGASVTINSFNALTKLAGQYATASLKKIATDTWLLFGNLG